MNTRPLSGIAAITAIALLSALLLSAGCASVGNEKLKAESEQSIQAKIVEGRTTKAEVRAQFGSPLKTSFTDGGMEIWNYEFSTLSTDAVSFIPVVSMFGSSASGTRKELVVMFDRAGVVQRFAMSESDVKQRSGVFTP